MAIDNKPRFRKATQEVGGRLYSERLAKWNLWFFCIGVSLIVTGTFI